MKAKKVVVTMEVSTDATMKDLRKYATNWRVVFITGEIFDVEQIQVNLVKDKKKKK